MHPGFSNNSSYVSASLAPYEAYYQIVVLPQGKQSSEITVWTNTMTALDIDAHEVLEGQTEARPAFAFERANAVSREHSCVCGHSQ